MTVTESPGARGRGAGERDRAAPAAPCRWPSAWRRSSPGLPGHAAPARLLVPLRDHVRGALHPDDDRRRHARGAVPGQEFLGRGYAPFARHDWMPGAMVSTALVVASWAYFIWAGSISTIWPMFGIANQLLASVALAVGTTVIINAGRARYAWVTLLPLSFVAVTTLTAGALSVRDNFYPMAIGPRRRAPLPGLPELDRHRRDDGLRPGDPGERDHALDSGPQPRARARRRLAASHRSADAAAPAPSRRAGSGVARAHRARVERRRDLIARVLRGAAATPRRSRAAAPSGSAASSARSSPRSSARTSSLGARVAVQAVVHRVEIRPVEVAAIDVDRRRRFRQLRPHAGAQVGQELDRRVGDRRRRAPPARPSDRAAPSAAGSLSDRVLRRAHALDDARRPESGAGCRAGS